MRLRPRGTTVPERCHATEKLLRSGRWPGADAGTVSLVPGVGTRRAEEAISHASARLSEAQSLLAPYRDSTDSPLGLVYSAVHQAKGDLAAANHWRALDAMVSATGRRDQ